MASSLGLRIAKLEQGRGSNLSQMIIVTGANSEAEARLILAARDIEVRPNDMVFEAPGSTPATVDIYPQTLCHEDYLAMLSVERSGNGYAA